MSGEDVTSDDVARADAGDADVDPADEEGLFPVDGRWFKIGFHLFLLAWMGFMVLEAAGYSRRMDWLLPLVIWVPVLAMLVARLVMMQFPWIVDWIMPTRDDEGEGMFAEIDSGGPRRTKTERERYEVYMIAWIVVLPFMMFYVGMGWTLLFYTFAFTYFFTDDARTSALVTGVVVLFTWVLFIEILQLIVWDGVLDIPGPLRIIADFRRSF